MPEKYINAPQGRQSEAISQGTAAPFVGEGLHQLHRDLNVGFYLQGYFPFTTHYEGVNIVNEIKPNERGATRVDDDSNTCWRSAGSMGIHLQHA